MRPKNIISQISPCISRKKLEIKELIQESFIQWINTDKFTYDMKRHISDQLMRNGVVNVSIDEQCTYLSTQKYFSYRRDKEKSGRMMGLMRV